MLQPIDPPALSELGARAAPLEAARRRVSVCVLSRCVCRTRAVGAFRALGGVCRAVCTQAGAMFAPRHRFGGGFGLGGAGRGARFGRRGGAMNDGFMMIMLAMRVFEALKVRCWRGA